MAKINYCKGVIIAHGKSEMIFAEYIKRNLRLTIEVRSKNHGRQSIQVTSLMSFLNNTTFRSLSNLKKECLFETQNRRPKNFFVFPIMDLDDANDRHIKNI